MASINMRERYLLSDSGSMGETSVPASPMQLPISESQVSLRNLFGVGYALATNNKVSAVIGSSAINTRGRFVKKTEY